MIHTSCWDVFAYITIQYHRLSVGCNWVNVFRMDEANTLSLTGLAGASNTLGAALYYVDFSMTMLQVSSRRVII